VLGLPELKPARSAATEISKWREQQPRPIISLCANKTPSPLRVRLTLSGPIDPTGGVTARTCATLARGLAITKEAGRESEAAEIVRKVLEQLTQAPHNLD
jgi:hypothetical protein